MLEYASWGTKRHLMIFGVHMFSRVFADFKLQGLWKPEGSVQAHGGSERGGLGMENLLLH